MFNHLKLILFLTVFINYLFALETSDENGLLKDKDTIQLTKSEKAYLKMHPVIKAHNEKNWPPFNFEEKGVAKGFAIDYMNLLAQKLGVKVEYISNYSWAEYMKMLQTQKLDVIINISKNEERAKTISFTNAFYSSQNAIYVHEKKQKFDKVEQLNNKTIAMPKGFFAQKFIEKYYPNIKQILVSDQLEALKLLSLGKVDATIGKKVVMDYIIAHNNISGVVPTAFIEDERAISHIRLGTSKEDTLLRDILQKAMDKVSDSQINHLKNKWFGTGEIEQAYELKLTQIELEYLTQKQKVTMCIDPDWIPFERFDDEGNYEGMSADYYKIFEKMIPVKFEVIKTNSWSESLENAKKRKCDILSLAMETQQRKRYMNFTEPYVNVPVVVVTQIDTPFISDIDFIKNKKIGIVKNGAFRELIKEKYKNLDVVEIETVREGLQKVESGKLFGFVDNVLSVGQLIQSDFSGVLKVSARFQEEMKLAIGVRNDDPRLLHILQRAVDNLSPVQKHEILNKWISIKYEKGIDYTFIWVILFVLFWVIVIFSYKQYRLKESIQEMGELIDATMEAIFISKGGICIDVNQSAVELFGYGSKEEMIGLSLIEFIADDSKEIVLQGLNLDDVKPYEGNVQKKNGQVFPALIRGHNLKSNPFRISSVVEITHLKQLESQNKLASMGKMIGNIAHQWRQPLNNTFLYLQFLRDNYSTADKKLINKYFTRSFDQINYMSQTIDDFTEFLKDEKKPVPYQLQENIQTFLKIVESTIKAHHIKTKIKECDNISLNGYPNELNQCFINIFNNSKDAFLENNINKHERYFFINQDIVDNNVIITFQDNAGGIREDVLPHVFEPYYTTKHQSKGTGLGLNMAYSLIVEGMNGTIKANNITYKYKGKEYRGATFIITLPIE